MSRRIVSIAIFVFAILIRSGLPSNDYEVFSLYLVLLVSFQFPPSPSLSAQTNISTEVCSSIAFPILKKNYFPPLLEHSQMTGDLLIY